MLAGGHHRAALDYASALLGQTSLMKAMALHTPDLHEEIEGIAEGSAQPFDRIAAYNLMDEQWWLDLSRIRAAPSARLSHLTFESHRAFPS